MRVGSGGFLPTEVCALASLRRGITVALLYVALSAIPSAPQPASDPSSHVTIDERIESMSGDERIAQLMFVSSYGNAGADPEIARWRVGGVVLYAHNLSTVAHIRRLTAAIRGAGGPDYPPFIAIDQEGGIVRRLYTGVPLVPSTMALGAALSGDLARRAGFAVGAALRNLGFTMNFTPVLDVLPESGPAALETRAFSNQPGLVADLGTAFFEGQRAAGIISVGKHFPGQGAAIEDTHSVLPILHLSRRDLDARDLLPFRLAIERGLPAMMTGHVALPRITGKSDLPATLSAEVMTKILRKDLRFEGVVISDALRMKPVSRLGSADTAAVQAVLAGCDMVLVPGPPQHREQVFDGLRRAYRDGTLTEARLRESLRRILTLKAVRFEHAATPPIEGDIAREVARKAVTVIGDGRILTTALRETLAYVGPTGAVQGGVRTGHTIILPGQFKESTRRRLREQTTAVLAKAAAWIAVAETDEQWRFIGETSASFPDLQLVYVNLGSPYRSVDGRRVVSVLTYSSSPQSQQAAADVVNGVMRATGVLPITLEPRTSSGASPDKRP